jgi:hypothetical protein
VESDFLTWLKQEALEAADTANAAAENANEKAGLANEAAETANTAAERANTLSDNPPKIQDNYWSFYNEALGLYIKSNHVAKGDKGESPRVSNYQTWEVYNNATGQWEDTGIDCSSDYVLTKEKVEGVLVLPKTGRDDGRHNKARQGVACRKINIVYLNARVYL